MFPQKSIRNKFIIQLVVTLVVLIGLFSIILYYFIKNTVYEDIVNSMQTHAQMVINSKTINDETISHNFAFNQGLEIVNVKQFLNKLHVQSFEKKIENEKLWLILYYPIKNSKQKFVVLKKQIQPTQDLLSNILKNIIIVNIFSFFAIVFFAFFLSKMLLSPVKILGAKLAKMNEKYLNHVDINNMYEEFKPLGESLNRLIDRVQTFIKYQTELFVGIAHELKTPLAVMKTKNEVTLIKQRDCEYYKEAINKNIDSVNEMNQMISAILEIGRQEGAQLKPPTVVDLVTFVKEKATNFKILAKQDGKDIALDIRPSAFPTLTQPTLVLHVLQNFVQNAIKFSDEGSIVTIQTRGDDDGFTIEVLDEGCGLNEDADIFAPFKKIGQKSGVGLGLFLAKGAAQALNAQISVKNRKDSKGTIATLFIPRQKPIK